MPPKSLLKGLYPGSIPDCLSCLNFIESSMISIYSCVSEIKLLSGTHHKKHGVTYSFVNDLVKTTNQLPRMVDKDIVAILRHEKELENTDYQYRPYYVWQALKWLKMNNHLYINIKIIWPEEIDKSSKVPINIPFFPMTDEEVAILNEEQNLSNITSGELSNLELEQEKEVLLFSKNEVHTHEEDIIRHLSNRNNSLVMNTQFNNRQFVSPYFDPTFFWSKCFPMLFPYGFGCPSDPDCQIKDLKQYTQHVLKRGGGPSGRRFQNCPNFYFAAYHYESRRKISGIASQAQNEYLDSADCDNDKITAKSLSGLVSQIQSGTSSYLRDDEVNNASSDSMEHFEYSTDNNRLNSTNETSTMSKEEFTRYVNRLSVYGKSLPGSTLHMKNERNNLMSMLASPVVQADGIWRWFVTFSPADIYEPKLYEILTDKNKEKMKELSKDERKKLLSDHPALAARLFHLKQECIWECILQGKN